MSRIKHLDEEFRRNAVDLLITSGRPLKRVAAELGVSANSLRSWRNRLLAQNESAGSGAEGAADIAGMTGEQVAAEFRRLHKEIDYLKRQREILKKAALILGEGPQ